MNRYAFDARYSYRSARKRSQPLAQITGVVMLMVIAFLAVRFSGSRRTTILSPLPDSDADAYAPASAEATDTPAPTSPDSAELSGAVRSALEGTSGTYGIVVKHLTTGETYSQDAHHTFESASLYKLWVMAAVYKSIQNKELREDQVLSDSVEHLNQMFQIDPDYAELTEGTVTLPVRDALSKMITVSDNYAALILTEKIGLSSVASFLKTYGFSESAVGMTGGVPTTTASDTALFLEKLYRGELANATYTGEMITLLKNQRLNDKLPKYLPDAVTVAHKTGELDSVSHDAGIVYTDNGPYIIVILTDSDNPPAAVERIAQVSKNVYGYFTE